MRCAIIQNNTIINVIEAEPGFMGSVPCPDGAGIGWTYDGTTWNPPVVVVPVPESVSMRQARLALLGAGVLATVDAAIAQGGEADKIEWEYATEVRRDAPLVTNMGLALGMTGDQLDDLFRAAVTL